MADERQNDREYDDLLADFHIAQAKKTAGQNQRPAQPAPPQKAPQNSRQQNRQGDLPNTRDLSNTRRNVGDIPRKADGTPCTPEELRQLQAYRQAMQNRQRTAPPTTGQIPRRQGEKARQTAAYEAAYRQQNTGSQGQKKPVYRHRKPNRPNGAVLLFAVLVLTVAGLSIGQIARNRSEAQTDPETVPYADEAEVLDTLPEETAEPEEEELVLWNTEVIDNALLDTGELILVNYAHPYDDADSIAVKDVYGNKNKYYQVANTGITLTQVTLDAMNAMTEAFYNETGSDDMMIVSGYRNVQSQRDIYNDRVATQGEEMAALYVASPGYSEHHTGLAMDLSFYTDEGTSISIENYEHGTWIDENCARFGFVLRYPSDKVDITKIGYEFWHYRYVGFPHADIMTSKHLCLEEYMDYIKQYTTDTKLLWIQKNGLMTEVSASALPSEGTLLYYVPMAEGDTTEIRIPRGNLFADKKISGNNMDGFIVTVQIGTTQP